MSNVGESTAGNVGKEAVGALAVGGEGVVVPSGDNAYANYPLTSDLLDTINGYTLVSTITPTPTANGIAITNSSGAAIVPTGHPVNDLRISYEFSVQTDVVGYAFYFQNASGTKRFGLYHDGARWRFSKYNGTWLYLNGDAVPDPTAPAAWNVTIDQATTGVSVTITSTDGYDWTGTDTGAIAQDDVDNTQNKFLLLGAGFEITIKDVRIAPL